MAEALYIPRFTAPPPVAPRVNFWTALDWDPYESRVSNGVHVVKDGKQAGVYLADGNDLIQLSRIPAVDPANLGNLVLRTLAAEGLVNGNRLSDELRYGTQPYLEPGRCGLFNGTSQYVSSNPATNIPTAFPFTLSAWFYSTSSSADQTIMGIGDSTWYFNYYHLYYDGTAQRLKTQRRDNDFAISETCGSVVVARDTWHHVAICYLSTTSFKYSINGSNWVTVSGTTAKNFPAANHYVAGVLRVIGGEAKLTGRLFDCRWWNRELNQTEINTVRAFGQVTSGLVNHWWLANRWAATCVDSSGNGNRGIVNGWSASSHYVNKDVPYSPANEVGWSEAYTGTNISANPGTAMTGAGTSPPTISNGTFFGKTGSAITFTAAGGDGYAASRAAGNAGSGIATVGKWYRTSCLIRLSRPLVGGEYINYYWTGTGGTHGVQIDENILNYGQGEQLEDGWIRLTSRETLITTTDWNVYPVLYKGTLSSDITAYVADHRMYEDFGNPVLPLSTNTANSLRNTPLEYKGKCPARPLVIDSNCLTLNGTSQYVPVGTGTWSTDGTQAMKLRFWIKTTDTDAVWFSHNTGEGLFTGWSIATAGTFLYLDWMASFASSNYLRLTVPSAPVLDNQWHEVEITYDGSKQASGVAVFFDGVQQATTTLSNTLTGSIAAPSAPSRIGTNSAATSQFLGGSIADPIVTIGSNSWGYRCAEGGNSDKVYDYINGTNHTIANAGNNWNVVQPKAHRNWEYGFRMGKNLLKWSQDYLASAETYWRLTGGGTVGTPNRPNAPDGSDTATLVTKMDAGGSRAMWVVPAGLSVGVTYTISVYVRAFSWTGDVNIGLLVNGAWPAWTMGILEGPATPNWQGLSGGAGSIPTIMNLSTTQWSRVRITVTPSSTNCQLFIYPASTAAGASGLGTDVWGFQLEEGSTASPYFHTKEVNGLVRIPAMKNNPLLAANGLPITHPAGDWHNLCESKIDFTCGQPLAPLFNGVTPPTAWKPGDVATGLASEKYSNKERAITLSK